MQTVLRNNSLFDNTYIVGTADLRGLLDENYHDFQYGISVAKKLDDKIIDAIENGPTLEYFKYYNQINNELAEKALELKNELQKIGIDSVIVKPTVSTSSNEFKDYLKNLTVDISHKMVATRAGLGWIGKTDLFVSKQFGPRLRLVSLLINKKPEVEFNPINESRCGKCNICVEKCPAQAASGELWNVNVHRDVFFDAQKCREKCGQLARERLNVDKRICGICVSVCPVGKRK
jgi:epoxyqueuosine reductase